ncbi:hypothetical protein E4U37_005926, partial [Claviceps purpurea]
MHSQVRRRNAPSPTYNRLKQKLKYAVETLGRASSRRVCRRQAQATQTDKTGHSIKSAFLTCDDGHLQYHRYGARPGDSSSQAAARNERERIQRHHRSVRRASDAQPPSLTPTT